MKKLTVVMLAMLLGAATALARPALKGTARVMQPDGSYVTIRLVGDEYMHYNATADGYSLVRNGNGYYVYARKGADGQLAPTSLVAHDAAERTAADNAYLESVGKWLTPERTEAMEQMRINNHAARAKALQVNKAASYDYSKFKGLVILVEFNDCPFRYDNYKDIMEAMINQENYTGTSDTNIPYNNTNRRYINHAITCTGSMRDYFRDNSMGMFNPTFDIVGPVKINYSQFDANGTNTPSNMMKDACVAADPLVNFKDYDVNNDGVVDMIYFIFSGLSSYIQGNDARLLWPHQFDIRYLSGTTRLDEVKLGRYACSTELFGYEAYGWSVLEGIGTMCHEFSHILGLPDFYDADGTNDCVTPSDWSIMASGSDKDYGRTPCGYSLFERYALGFAQPRVISEPGEFSIDTISVCNTGYRLNTPVSKEYFLIENRQKKKWDAGLPGHGMLIFRVDSTNTNAWQGNRVNSSPNHPYYELIRAGGVKTDENGTLGSSSDPFPGTSGITTINNQTTPNLKTWTNKRNNAFGLRNITETKGIISFEAYDVNVLTGVIISQETVTLGVGTTMQLSATSDPEAIPCTFEWSGDNPEVATVDENGVVTGIGVGTAHVTVTANGTFTATCEVTVSDLDVAADIASFRALEEGSQAMLQLTDAQVLHVNKNDIYLRDATGSIVLSETGLNVAKGNMLNGVYYGKASRRNLMPILTKVSGKNLSYVTVSEGSEPEPKTLYLSQLTSDYYGDLVLVDGVTLKKDGGIFAIDDNHKVRLYNTFKLSGITVPSVLDDKYFAVKAIFGTNTLNGNIIDEFYLLASPTESTNVQAIEAVTTATPASATTYNLSGQKVSATYKGIVIRNGKMVVNK